jgi:hypothetical protein
MDGHLPGRRSAMQQTMLAEHGPLQYAATGNHLADGGSVAQQMMPLQRDLPRDRASRLLDGQPMLLEHVRHQKNEHVESEV